MIFRWLSHLLLVFGILQFSCVTFTKLQFVDMHQHRLAPPILLDPLISSGNHLYHQHRTNIGFEPLGRTAHIPARVIVPYSGTNRKSPLQDLPVIEVLSPRSLILQALSSDLVRPSVPLLYLGHELVRAVQTVSFLYWSTQNEIDLILSTKHQEVWRESGDNMLQGSVSRHHRLDVFVPVTLTLTDYLADHLIQCPVEPLQHAIGGRPVRACSDLPDAQRLVPIRDQFAFKLGALVGQ